MSALLTSTAIGILAAWPAAGLGWALGKAADAITEDPGPRARAWDLGRALPAAALGLVVLASQLPTSVAPPVVAAIAAAPTMQEVKAASVDLAVQSPWLPDLFSLGAAALIAASAAGLTLAAARQALGRRRLARIVREARPAPAALVQANQIAAARLGVIAPPILVSDAVDQPLMVGLSRPVILLPSALVDRLDTPRLALICAHELAHLKRRDNWRLLVESLVGGLFWMVPPAVFLRARAAAVREELCDRMALGEAPADARRDYADSLIQVLRLRAAPSPHPAFTGKEGNPTAMRLKAILQPRRPADLARKAVLVAMGALAVTAVGAGSLAAAEHRESGHTLNRTTITSDEKGRRIDVEITGAYAQILGENSSAYEGNVRLKIRQKSPATIVRVDGRPAPADFDPDRLAAGAIKRVVITNRGEGETTEVILDVTLAKPGDEAKNGSISPDVARSQNPFGGMKVLSEHPAILAGGPRPTYVLNGVTQSVAFDPNKVLLESVTALDVTSAGKKEDRETLVKITTKPL